LTHPAGWSTYSSHPSRNSSPRSRHSLGDCHGGKVGRGGSLVIAKSLSLRGRAAVHSRTGIAKGRCLLSVGRKRDHVVYIAGLSPCLEQPIMDVLNHAI